MIRSYVHDWIVEINDLTPLTNKIRRLCDEGKYDLAKRHLPDEKTYDVAEQIAQRLGMLD